MINEKIRAGEFSIPKIMLKQNPEAVKEAMGKCIIFKAEEDWPLDSIRYFAISDEFSEIDYGQRANHYNAMFYQNEDNSVSFIGFEMNNNYATL